ncbi:MAG: aspartate aminotransferase family protein [Betaproteobacteria bacterium]|jgi:beta-alanine--pyruvate transaminase|uniref:Omega-amino acid--pyruvate aminotransferase n=1 Tax=Thiomonas delicata TaxID=364030 RepID=A0A238D6I6_THIDL|nr:aspartate aminotransferase family protein [Betaproteobacteria bacterium]OZB44806.1 MAG: aspartate aminotransferase family protein [Thiomonas sp. 15-66-11]OZB62318.1 MAG: aspartate aminotransferase family protein [Thiomonas sp. 13-66-29]SBP88839.1 Omega-amino acid--pyruvate aminotransferase [Thiomonas delicata]
MDQTELTRAGRHGAVDLPNLDALWMPFTANRDFKAAPRMLVSAQGMHYRSHDGREILDGVAGLWCVNAGHGREEIVEAIARQAREMDYAPPFQMGHPVQFEAADLLAKIAPGDLTKIFFTNSGSESVDTALKIALAYHRARGEGTRTMFIGRERGYHGVGFGGISVGGMVANRKVFRGGMLPNVDHLPHTYSAEHQAFSRGQPEWGAHLADDLERLVQLHDASNIAAVIVEPMAGSTGVLVPPKGYLDKLRAICSKYGILLIFDEVISGYGRLGTPFAAQRFKVTPDIMTTAKAVNNAAVPLGAVFVREGIYDAVVNGAPSGAVEFFHGYTYSGHPLAMAAAVAAQNIYARDGLLTRVAREGLDAYWEEAMHGLRDAPHVKDIRNLGLVAGIELHSRPEAAGKRAFETFLKCYELGVLVRYTGDTIALSPPLIIKRGQIDQIADTLRRALSSVQ